MSLQAQVEIGTGRVLALGTFEAGSPDPETVEIVDLTAEQEAVIRSETVGQRVIGESGAVTITPPPDPPEPEPTKNDILLSLLDGLEPGDEATEVMLLVFQEMLRP